jgi:hypothetical protein
MRSHISSSPTRSNLFWLMPQPWHQLQTRRDYPGKTQKLRAKTRPISEGEKKDSDTRWSLVESTWTLNIPKPGFSMFLLTISASNWQCFCVACLCFSWVLKCQSSEQELNHVQPLTKYQQIHISSAKLQGLFRRRTGSFKLGSLGSLALAAKTRAASTFKIGYLFQWPETGGRAWQGAEKKLHQFDRFW